MSVLSMFAEFPDITGTVYHNVSTQNASGQLIDTPTKLQENVTGKMWTDASIETNVSDQFVGQETGRICFDPASISFTPDETQWLDVDGVKYYFTGEDNVIRSSELYVINYRKERKSG